MNKGIGFHRKILLSWLDCAGSYCGQSNDLPHIREQLDEVVRQDVDGPVSRRMAVDILVNIWLNSRDISPNLHHEALTRYQATSSADERLWLHYGLVLLAYPFFREIAAVIGQLARQGQAIASAEVKRRLAASRGDLGSLNQAVQRVVFSLRDWGLLVDSGKRYRYVVRNQPLATDDQGLQLWLLACALRAHPAKELPSLDLLRLPELFAFRITVGLDALRRSPHFAVDRQGTGWDSVRLVD